MRLHRLLVAVSLLALLPTTAAQAQQSRLFDNSWFWGVHAGATEIGTPATAVQAHTTVGADWLITRSMGGLYVSYDQATKSLTPPTGRAKREPFCGDPESRNKHRISLWIPGRAQ